MYNYKNCPFCSNETIIKYGRYKNIQRYKCKCCNKTFSESTNSIWFNSKKASNFWYEYCFLMFSGNSIRSCASKLNISIATSFKWRHKILNKLPNCNKTNFLYRYIGLQHVHFLESFKGQKALPLNLLNVPRKKVFVSIAINEKYISFSKIISKGMLNQSNSFNILSEKINFNSKVIGLSDRYSPAIALRLNKYLMNLKEYPKDKKITLKDTLYNFYYQLKLWLGLFKGVATKYLNAYLDWFVHIYENSFNNKVMTSKIINAIFYS